MIGAIIHHELQRVAQRRGGDASFFAAVNAAQLSAARKDAQDRPLTRAGTYRTGGDAPLVRTNSRTAGGGCIHDQRRRALRLLPGRLATLHSRRGIRSRLQFAPVIGQLCQDHANRPECHSSLTFGVTLQHLNRDTDQRSKSWNIQPTRTAQ